MRIYKWLIGCMLLGFMSTNACAQNLADCFSCEDFFCNVRYHVYADYLYWRAFRSGVGVATSTISEDRDLYVCPNYSSGYRVGGRILWNCLDLGVRYTSYCKTTSHSAVGDITATTNLFRYNVDYQDVDVELGALFCFSCGNSFLRPYVGAKFVWLDERVKFFTNDVEQGTPKLKDRAYGLYIGTEGKLGLFNLCDVAVGLRARGSFGLLDGNHKFRIAFPDDETTNFARECHIVGYTDVFAGLDISYCDCFCFDLNLQIGYELQQYIRDFNNFVTSSIGTILNLDNIAFGGLVVRFGVYF
ncbi:MAG: Lpg1974 family pore-forming outer membrane protein [Chlamydiales bacterium]